MSRVSVRASFAGLIASVACASWGAQPGFDGLTPSYFLSSPSQPAPAPVPVPESLRGAPIDNFGVVSDGLYRGASIKSSGQYAYLSEVLGVRTVVDLESSPDDDAYCFAYKLRCVHYPIALYPGQDKYFNWETLKQAFQFVIAERSAGRKVFFHCWFGGDRTGALAAAFMIRGAACGRSFDKDALWLSVDAELRRHHFHSVYFHLRRGIKNLVYGFEANPWLCR